MPTLTFEAADSTGPLPMTFSFSFTGKFGTCHAHDASSSESNTCVGTEFNVVGNDWHDGIVIFTLDGVASPPFDLSSEIHNVDVRCRFSWYNRTGLTPTTHNFTFSLVAPSAAVASDNVGGTVPGNATYYGLQFYYFS